LYERIKQNAQTEPLRTPSADYREFVVGANRKSAKYRPIGIAVDHPKLLTSLWIKLEQPELLAT
jgi:hypothetical protein